MKIAFCLNGVVGGNAGKSGQGSSEEVLEIGHRYFKENIFDKNDVDVFVHSWTVDMKDKILELYNPKKHVIEPQIWWDKNPWRGFRMNNHMSKWYSTQKSVELKTQYEIENNFEYDFVFVSRFDIAWLKEMDFKTYDKNAFYVGHWNRRYYLNGKEIKNRLYYNYDLKEGDYIEKLVGYPYNDEGLIDQWFFSNSKNMDLFSTLFDNFDKYDSLGSETHDHEGSISNHRLALHHLKQVGLLDKLKNEFYLHDDFPLIRRWHFKCGR